MRVGQLISGPGKARFYPALQPAALCILLLLSACTASIYGAPDRMFPIAADVDQLRRVSGPEWYYSYAQATGPTKQARRDQIVFSRMYAIDLAYSRYELALTREQQSVGFLSTLAQLGVSTTGTFIGGASTKAVLHAVEAGLIGVEEGYEKEILVEKTIAILQQQMRAQRQTVKAKIIERVAFGPEVYPLEFALSDLEEYYRAGTLTGALIGASKDAGATLEAADRREEEVISTRFAETDVSQRLFDYYMESSLNADLVKRWLAKNNIRLVPIQFIYSDDRMNQLKIIDELSIP